MRRVCLTEATPSDSMVFKVESLLCLGSAACAENGCNSCPENGQPIYQVTRAVRDTFGGLDAGAAPESE